ncbi:MAG: hypothetical protein N2482_01100 [Patescibacteria group bacterium]|nr:hypothetical protein [Patescibacteria group bacterium]
MEGTIISDISGWFSKVNFLHLFLKLAAIVFSLVYFGFTVIIYKQTTILDKTFQTKFGRFLILISLLQILVGLITILLAIFWL